MDAAFLKDPYPMDKFCMKATHLDLVQVLDKQYFVAQHLPMEDFKRELIGIYAICCLDI